MNLLLTSVGRRVKVVRYFKEAWRGVGQVIAVDCDRAAPALYAADVWEQMPRIHDHAYVDSVLELCRRHRVRAVLSLIDPELSVLAAHAERFREQGVALILSSAEVVDRCLDKQATHDYLVQHHLPCIPTYSAWHDILRALDTGRISFPLMVKPRRGSASLGMRKVADMPELEMVFFSQEDLIVQPFVEGVEHGVDAYIDMISGDPVSIFTKKKIRMRAGETDRSIAIKDERLTTLVHQLLAALPFVGPIDIDCFLADNDYVISEINPRFGGGYPHAYECGENFMRFIRENLLGHANSPRIGHYREGSTMMKYDDLILLE